MTSARHSEERGLLKARSFHSGTMLVADDDDVDESEQDENDEFELIDSAFPERSHALSAIDVLFAGESANDDTGLMGLNHESLEGNGQSGRRPRRGGSLSNNHNHHINARISEVKAPSPKLTSEILKELLIKCDRMDSRIVDAMNSVQRPEQSPTTPTVNSSLGGSINSPFSLNQWSKVLVNHKHDHNGHQAWIECLNMLHKLVMDEAEHTVDVKEEPMSLSSPMIRRQYPLSSSSSTKRKRKQIISSDFGESWENKILDQKRQSMLDYMNNLNVFQLLDRFQLKSQFHHSVLLAVLKQFRRNSGLFRRRFDDRRCILAFMHVFIQLMEWILCTEFCFEEYPMIHIPRTMREIRRPKFSDIKSNIMMGITPQVSTAGEGPNSATKLVSSETPPPSMFGARASSASASSSSVPLYSSLPPFSEVSAAGDAAVTASASASGAIGMIGATNRLRSDVSQSDSDVTHDLLLGWADGFQLIDQGLQSGLQIRNDYQGMSHRRSLSNAVSIISLKKRGEGSKDRNNGANNNHNNNTNNNNSKREPSSMRGIRRLKKTLKDIRCQGCRQLIHVEDDQLYIVYYCQSAEHYFIFHNSQECVMLRKLKESLRMYIMHSAVWFRRHSSKSNELPKQESSLSPSSLASSSSSSSSSSLSPSASKKAAKKKNDDDFAGFERGHGNLSEDILKLLTMNDSLCFSEQRTIRPPTTMGNRRKMNDNNNDNNNNNVRNSRSNKLSSVLNRSLSMAAFYKFQECEAMILRNKGQSQFDWNSLKCKDISDERESSSSMASSSSSLSIAEQRRMNYFSPMMNQSDESLSPPRLPSLFRRLDFLTYGPSLWSFCIEQMQTKERPSVWRTLEYLCLVMPSNLCVKLLFKYIHELARMTQSTHKLDVLSQIIVETAQFPMAAALMLAHWFRRRYEINEKDEDNLNGIMVENGDINRVTIINSFTLYRKYIRISQCFLERIESDQLIALILENPTNFEHMSIFDIALKYHLDDFLSFHRLQPVIDQIWYNDVRLLDPSVVSFAVETRLSLLDIWMRLISDPAGFYFSPMGLYCVSTLLYVGYLIFVSYFSYREVYPYHDLLEFEVVFWMCNFGYGLFECMQFHFMGAGLYFSEVSNWFDMSIVLNWGLLFCLRWVIPSMIDNRYYEAHTGNSIDEETGNDISIDCSEEENSEDDVSEAQFHCEAQSRNKPYNVGFMMVWSTNLILLWMKLANYLERNPKFGLLLRMMSAMVSDIFNFMVVALVLTVGFVLSVRFVIADDIDPDRQCGSDVDLSTLPTQTLYIIQTLLGQQEWGNLDSNECFGLNRSRAVQFFVVIYALLGSIMLLNLLIAMMASTYETVRDRARLEVKFNLVKSTIESQLSTAVMPPPFNMIVVLIVVISYVFRVMVYICTLGWWQLESDLSFPIHYQPTHRSSHHSTTTMMMISEDSDEYSTVIDDDQELPPLASTLSQKVLSELPVRQFTTFRQPSDPYADYNNHNNDENGIVELKSSDETGSRIVGGGRGGLRSQDLFQTTTTVSNNTNNNGDPRLSTLDNSMNDDSNDDSGSCCYGWFVRRSSTNCCSFWSGITGTAFSKKGATICRHCRHDMSDDHPGQIQDYFSWFITYQTLDKSDKHRVQCLLESTPVCSNCFRPYKHYYCQYPRKYQSESLSESSRAEEFARVFSESVGNTLSSSMIMSESNNNTNLVNDRYHSYQRNVEVVSFYVFVVFLYVPMVFLLSIPAFISWMLARMKQTDPFTLDNQPSSRFDHVSQASSSMLASVDREFHTQVENVLEACGCADYADGRDFDDEEERDAKEASNVHHSSEEVMKELMKMVTELKSEISELKTELRSLKEERSEESLEVDTGLEPPP